MKICWDNLNKYDFYLTKSGNFRSRTYKRTYHIKVCECCGEECLVSKKNRKYCSQSCSNIGENNPMFGKNKNKNGNWKGGYGSVPLYDTYAYQIDWIENCRRNKEDPNILEVECAYCGKWFIPKVYNVYDRIASLKGEYKGEHRFYCSESCKKECPIYNKMPITLMKEDAIRAGRLNWIELNREVQPQLRQMVLKRDKYTCQKCGSTEHLHCHHIFPASIEPIESADIDNCITLCKGCHAQVHKLPGCRYNELRMCM